MRLALMIVYIVSMIDEVFQFRYAIKRDRQLSKSGEQPLGTSTYYMMLGYVLILSALLALGMWLLPSSGTVESWVFLLEVAGLYVGMKLLATLIQTLFVFFAIRKRERYYKTLSKSEGKGKGADKNGSR